MDFAEIIDIFKQSAFDTDCKEMVLTQNKNGGASLKGPGYIRQSADGTLIFKIYVSERENINPSDHINERFGGLPGKLLADGRFYDLAAIGHDDTRWTAQRVLPSLSWDLSDSSVLVTGQILTLHARIPSTHPHPYLRLHFFQEYEVPLNRWTEIELHGDRTKVRDRAEFEALGANFEVCKRGNDTIFEIRSEADFPLAFHLRVQEALQYLTAKPANWRARMEIEGGDLCLELASPLRRSERTQFSPPLSPASSGFHRSGWQLFACFLAYVSAQTKNTHWNPIAYHLHNACEATANSIDAWAMGCSVAVEAVAGAVQLDQDNEKAKRVTELKIRMLRYLEAQIDFEDMMPRMKGLIGTLGQERVQDKMYHLVATGHVDPVYVKAWGRLRNRLVHPKIKDLRKPDSVDMQNLLDLIHQVEVLLRQITFYLIDYTGPFTDYGTDGFPTKQYPMMPPVAGPLTENVKQADQGV